MRTYGDDLTIKDHTVPLLASVFLDQDLTFTVGTRTEADAMKAADPDHTRIVEGADGDWTVTRLAGTEIRVPRKIAQRPNAAPLSVRFGHRERVGVAEPELDGRGDTERREGAVDVGEPGS